MLNTLYHQRGYPLKSGNISLALTLTIPISNIDIFVLIKGISKCLIPGGLYQSLASPLSLLHSLCQTSITLPRPEPQLTLFLSFSSPLFQLNPFIPPSPIKSTDFLRHPAGHMTPPSNALLGSS